MPRLLLLLLLLPTAPAYGQSDAEKFAEGRIALDKYRDCPAAKTALESVSEKGRSEPLWLFYAAKTYECLNQPENALPLYEKYNQLMPGQTAIIDKIGELRYQATKAQEERDRQRAAEEKARERKRAEDLKLQESAAANNEAALRAHLSAQQNLPETVAKLSDLISGNFDNYDPGFKVLLRRQVTNSANCSISYHEDQKAGWWSHNDVTFSLVGLRVESKDGQGVSFSSSVKISGTDQRPRAVIGSHDVKRADSESERGYIELHNYEIQRKVADLLAKAALGCTAPDQSASKQE